MFNKSELDERQLLMRGKVYQHVVILYVMIIILDSFLTSFDIKWVDGIQQKMTIMVMFPIMIGTVEMIFKDIMVVELSGIKFAIISFGFIAGVLSILNFNHVFIEKELIFENGFLSSRGGDLLYNIFLWVIVVAYCLKYYSEKKNEGVED